MDTIKLVLPTLEMEQAAKDYINEHREHNEPDLHGGALLEHLAYPQWIEQIHNNIKGENINPAWVPASTFFGIRERDGKIVGIIDIRHTLNEVLREYGGHIGFGIRPSERKKGYASQMLEAGLEYSRDKLHLEKVMLACYKENEASRNTILKYGGKLEREFIHTDQKTVQVFWIHLLESN